MKLRFIRKIKWQEVFEGWKKREAQNFLWIRCATEVKGWPDWESWRKYSANQIKAAEREWRLCEFIDPANEIPKMLIGPFSGWQSRLAEKNIASFDDLLNIPKQIKEFSGHEGVLNIMRSLPFSTEFIGIIRDDKIVCLEGHHRATAITLAKKQGRIFDFSGVKITIALTSFLTDENYLFDEMLSQGSSNPKR